MAISEWINNLIFYSKENPLIFTNLVFWVFFVLVYGGFSAIHTKLKIRNAYLFLISLFFYYKTGGFFFALLLFSTVVDFNFGKLIYKSKRNNIRKIWLVLSIVVNLSVLAYYKYAYFLIDVLNEITHNHYLVKDVIASSFNKISGLSFNTKNIILPIGISFYTFQTMSYTVDIYKRKLKPVNSILDFGFYVSFFPQLVAGPIVRAKDFIPQIHKKFWLTKKHFGIALFWILNGLIKKMVFADYLAVNFIDRIFEDPVRFSGLENITALFGYSMQVYLDFSGYTDIAIGLAMLFGFWLPQNFNSPYKAQNVGQYWKRWHISLSTWLKDYLYIPLGGNRNGTMATYILLFFMILIFIFLDTRYWLFLYFMSVFVLVLLAMFFYPKVNKAVNTNINIMLTMLIGGLWHGSSWNFVIWGGLNGVALIFYKYWKRISPWEKSQHWIAVSWKIAITFIFVTFTRLYFRTGSNLQHMPAEANKIARNTARQMLNKITNSINLSNFFDFISMYPIVIVLILLALVIHWLSSRFKRRYRLCFALLPTWAHVIVSILVLLLIIFTKNTESQPFIYFQF